MVSRLQPDRTEPAASSPASSRSRAGGGSLPGWRPLAAAIVVVALLALVLHLLYG
jgi:anti-sigma-K factor RskA